MLKKNWFERNPKKILIIIDVIIITVLLFFVEYASGIYFKNLPAKYDNGKRIVERELGIRSDIESSIISHPYLLYTLAPNYSINGSIEHNSLGYRSGEFKMKKDENTVRLLVLGGSTAYASGVSKKEDTWVYKLENKLQKISDKKIEVINAGLPYATSAELLAGYIFRHRFLEPDVIIIHTGGNDVAPLLFPNYNPEYTHFRAHGKTVELRKYEKYLLKSNFMKVFYSFWLNPSESVYQPQPYAFQELDKKAALERVKNNPSEGFRRNIDYLVKSAKVDRAEVVLFGFLQAKKENLTKNRPDLIGLEEHFILGVKKNNNILKKLSEMHNIMYIEPIQDLFDDDMFIDNCHLNKEGQGDY